MYGPCPIVTRVIYFAFLLTFFREWYIVENILLFSIISFSIFTRYYDKNVYNELLVLKNCQRNFTSCKSWDCEQNSPPNHLQLVLYSTTMVTEVNCSISESLVTVWPRKECNFTFINTVVPRYYLQMIWRIVTSWWGWCCSCSFDSCHSFFNPIWIICYICEDSWISNWTFANNHWKNSYNIGLSFDVLNQTSWNEIGRIFSFLHPFKACSIYDFLYI